MSRLPALPTYSPAARGVQLVALLAMSTWLGGCAVGPDYRRPDAPAVDRYTAQPLPASTATVVIPDGDAQRFLAGRDVPQRW